MPVGRPDAQSAFDVAVLSAPGRYRREQRVQDAARLTVLRPT